MTSSNSAPAGPDATPKYTAPKLTELGRVSAMTLGNSGKKGDNHTKKK